MEKPIVEKTVEKPTPPEEKKVPVIEPVPVPKLEPVDTEKIILINAKPHSTVKGDSLIKIAKKHYGTKRGYYFPLIMMASSLPITNPDLIEPSVVFTVPDFDKNMNSKSVRAEFKIVAEKIANDYKSRGNTVAFQNLMKIVNSL